MSLIESHCHYTFNTKLYRSEKVTLEPLGVKEETNTDQKFEYHYTYNLNNGSSFYIRITFMCIGEPNIEKVNKLLKNIIKSIYKLTFINDQPEEETSPQRYEQIIKDSINYTSFKHLFLARYTGQKEGSFLVQVC